MGSSESTPIVATSTTTIATTTVRPVLQDTSLHRMWEIEPIYQQGTPWLSTANPLAIDIIFWISCFKCIYALPTGLITYRLGNQGEFGRGHKPKKPKGYVLLWLTLMLSGLVIPLLGVFAVMTDSQETLKAFCIIIIISSLFCLANLGKQTICGFFPKHQCLFFLLFGISFCLHVVPIVFAWPFAFPAQIETEITKRPVSDLFEKLGFGDQLDQLGRFDFGEKFGENFGEEFLEKFEYGENFGGESGENFGEEFLKKFGDEFPELEWEVEYGKSSGPARSHHHKKHINAG